MTNESVLFIAKHYTNRDKFIVCVVSEKEKSVIDNAPANISIKLRDFHGYGNDYDLYACEIQFTPIPREYTEATTKFFSPYIDQNEDAIYSLLREISENQGSK